MAFHRHAVHGQSSADKEPPSREHESTSTS